MFNPAKRLRKCSGRSQIAGELQGILEGLETIIQDAAEFVQLSGRYPRLARQPYSMYLLLDNFMFSRQMEMEHIMNFLHHGAQDPSAEHLGVLPIVGPVNVGKSILVEHVCMDEGVRGHFSQIMFISGSDLSGEDMVTLANETGVIKYENQSGSAEARILIIVEADRDINEDSWQRLYSASKARLARGSKIIVTTRSDKIIGLGTTLPLRLQFLPQKPTGTSSKYEHLAVWM
ncbi:hypothetical protein PR202_ga25364 [Eleusine coracana subsp. coracana]|uniref:NB-ARC domain-containing protein n=1 Tax=Eleusine coracana subsp. coracana TaxID=191504 RepID=A0AAV5DB35_ELECO|nr:hypothetical protein PR202_ga25364 [Eleusine coracana subsp. coracana]